MAREAEVSTAGGEVSFLLIQAETASRFGLTQALGLTTVRLHMMESEMKSLLFAAMLFLAVAGQANGQGVNDGDSVEQTIRELDRIEADAVLRGDYSLIDQIWSDNFTVNNPFNKVVTASAGPIRTGELTYSSFLRQIESVQVHGNTAIVMGQEIVVPKGDSTDAGKTIRRRYTNIWIKEKDKWLLTARHANVICLDDR